MITHSQTFAIWKGETGQPPHFSQEFSLDSTDIISVRLDGVTQRGTTIQADVSGRIFADGTGIGVPVSLDALEYSAVSVTGSWTAVDDILTSDPSYNWPGTGSLEGSNYNVPVEVEDYSSDQLWFKITVGY